MPVGAPRSSSGMNRSTIAWQAQQVAKAHPGFCNAPNPAAVPFQIANFNGGSATRVPCRLKVGEPRDDAQCPGRQTPVPCCLVVGRRPAASQRHRSTKCTAAHSRRDGSPLWLRSWIGAHRVADQGFAQRPYRARDTMTVGDDRIEGTQDPIAIGIGNDQRRQKLDGVTGVAGDLTENFVLLEERYGNELAE